MSDNGAHEHHGADAMASGGIKAGEAFRRLLETDPATQAAWKRARARFQAIVKAFRVFMELDPETRAAWDREWAQLREELADAWADVMRELEARHFPRPETIEDWEHLARILGLSNEAIGHRTGGGNDDDDAKYRTTGPTAPGGGKGPGHFHPDSLGSNGPARADSLSTQVVISHEICPATALAAPRTRRQRYSRIRYRRPVPAVLRGCVSTTDTHPGGLTAGQPPVKSVWAG